MKMTKHIWTIFLIGIFTFCTNETYSCECLYIGYGDKTNLDFEIANSNFILTASIIEKLDSTYPAYFRIKVIKTWKGETNGITILTTGTGGGDCGMFFKIGTEYLIYGDSKNGNIYANRCSRTIELSKTGDIDYLNNHFFKTDYDSISFTPNELSYIKLNLIHSDLDSLLSSSTKLIFYNDRLITKKGLIGLNPNILSVEYRYLSLGDRKLINPKLFRDSMNGVLVLYDSYYHKQINRYKLIKKLNKCTAGNTVYTP